LPALSAAESGAGVGLTLSRRVTIISSGANSNPKRTAILRAGHRLSTAIIRMDDLINVSDRLYFDIEYITFEGNGGTDFYRTECDVTLSLVGSGFHFYHNEVKHSCGGNGLYLVGDHYDMWDNYIAYNGRDRFDHTYLPGGGPWSDGFTVAQCDNGTIRENVFVDNTDIDLVIGGGPHCTVSHNTIWHGGKYAYAGLNIGYFVENTDPGGCHGVPVA